MCMTYNGIDYHHGICVTKQTEVGPKCFDVMVTKHTENQPYRYSGICLNNGYEVCTNKYTKPEALLELLERIVADTLASEKEYTTRYPGESFVPLVNIKEKNPDVYNEFSIKMKNARLLNEYNDTHEELKQILEKPRFDYSSGKNKPIELSRQLMDATVSIQSSKWPVDVVYDCKDMNLTFHFVKRNKTLKDCEIKYSRV